MERFWYRIKDLIYEKSDANRNHLDWVLLGHKVTRRATNGPPILSLSSGASVSRLGRVSEITRPATSCLATSLKCVAINAFRHWPIIGNASRRVMSQFDWQAFATRLMDDAWSDILWDIDLSGGD